MRISRATGAKFKNILVSRQKRQSSNFGLSKTGSTYVESTRVHECTKQVKNGRRNSVKACYLGEFWCISPCIVKNPFDVLSIKEKAEEELNLYVNEEVITFQRTWYGTSCFREMIKLSGHLKRLDSFFIHEKKIQKGSGAARGYLRPKMFKPIPWQHSRTRWLRDRINLHPLGSAS